MAHVRPAGDEGDEEGREQGGGGVVEDLAGLACVVSLGIAERE